MFNRKSEQNNDQDEFTSDQDEQISNNETGADNSSTLENAQATSSEYRVKEALKPSLISEGFEFSGDVVYQGTLTVDGSLRGNINVQNLLIGVTGKIIGVIKATSIQVRGTLQGEASCQDLTLGSQSNVDAKINYSTLTIQRGANIQGELKKSD